MTVVFVIHLFNIATLSYFIYLFISYYFEETIYFLFFLKKKLYSYSNKKLGEYFLNYFLELGMIGGRGIKKQVYIKLVKLPLKLN